MCKVTHVQSDTCTAAQVGDQQNLGELQRRRNRARLLQSEARDSNAQSPSDQEAPDTSSAGTTETGDRCFLCFVADSQPAWPNHLDTPGPNSPSISQAIDPINAAYPKAPSWVRLALWALNREKVGECWGVSYQQRGVLGTVVYDTFGFHIPGKFQDGCWHRRRNIGYISNLAVVPGARR